MTPDELHDIVEMHKQDKLLPFIELELKNGMIVRLVRMNGRYVCIMNATEANFFLTGEWQ